MASSKERFITFVCCVVASVATTLLMHTFRPDNGLKIAVVDYGKVIESIPTDASDVQRDEIMSAVQTQIRKLGAAGYLVVNGSAMLYTPESLRVPQPKINQVEPSTVAPDADSGADNK